MGESTVAMAAARPEVNLLAVEVYKPGVAQTLHHLNRAGVQNVRVMRGDGVQVLTDLIAPGQPGRGLAVLPRPLAEDEALQAPAGHARVRRAGGVPVAPRRQSSGWPPTGRRTRSGCSPRAPRPRACATRTPAGRRGRSSGRGPGSSAAGWPPGTRSSIWSSPAADRRRPAYRGSRLTDWHSKVSRTASTNARLLAQVDDRGHRAAAVGALVRRGHRHEDRRVAGHRRGDPADAGLDLPMPVHVGVVEHGVAPAAHLAVLARPRT